MGWRNCFSSCAVVSVFGSGGEQVLVLHTYILTVQYSCGGVLVFWFWREIVFGVKYVFSVHYSCTVVSVFWLWREIVFKMRTRFYKKVLLGYFFMICQPMSVFIRPNTLLLCIVLFCIFLLYRTDPQVEVQIRILLNKLSSHTQEQVFRGFLVFCTYLVYNLVVWLCQLFVVAGKLIQYKFSC